MRCEPRFIRIKNVMSVIIPRGMEGGRRGKGGGKEVWTYKAESCCKFQIEVHADSFAYIISTVYIRFFMQTM